MVYLPQGGTSRFEHRRSARECADHRQRSDKQLEALREDILELERDLENCTAPGAPRRRIERLLSKAATRENGGRPPELPSVGATNS